ncbi:MAG: 50S ribosomal protein L4, partial [Nocardioidaceae bacterium]
MSVIDVLDASGSKAGTVDLPAEIFDTQVNIPLIHQVVVAQLAAARQGTHATKSRGEVSGGGRKPYRQKGTGRARQGSIRAPQFTGGGVVHGPTPHGYEQRTPKKMKAAALRGALSDRAREGRVHVVASFVEGDRPSTKTAMSVLARLSERPRALVVVERGDQVTWRSLRNVERIHVLVVDQLNTYDVLASDDVIFTKAAFDALVARPAKGRRATSAGSDEVPSGAGSAAPLESGDAPDGFTIKGNTSSMKYHQPDGQWYEQTVAEVWFDSAESAERAGFVEAGSKASIEANEADEADEA